MTNPLSDENRKTLERVFGWPNMAAMKGQGYAALEPTDLNALMNAVREESAATVQGDVREAVERVLDATSAYMKQQYGIGALSHPIDRQRILSTIRPETRGEAVAALKDAIEGECDGLAINDEQARSILQYLAHPAPPIPAEVEALIAEAEHFKPATQDMAHTALCDVLDRMQKTLRGQAVQVGEAQREAVTLATSLHQQFYADVTQWRPLEDPAGVISQIDNMIAGILSGLRAAEAERDTLRADNERLREALAKILTAQDQGDEIMVIETAQAALNTKGGE